MNTWQSSISARRQLDAMCCRRELLDYTHFGRAQCDASRRSHMHMTISFIDPPAIRHLGEFASLKKAILSHFDGDSGLRYPTDEGRWHAIVSYYKPNERELIAIQIRELLSRDDAF